ncbi:MAG: glycosyltransferase family 39 protein [SAR324 cluster bacterium]|nr:glycosyltransferase family 39 protein [SAR324 cluster bacterium]
MQHSNQNKDVWFIILTLFTLLFLLLGLGASPLIDWDENIYAEASRQMVERGDYLNVYINNYPFAEKPPFFFWAESASYHLFGINEFAARFPSAMAGLFTVWLCYFFGRWLESSRFGIMWGLIYLTSFLPGLFARSAVIDHTFNFFIMSAAFSLYAYDVGYGEFLSKRKAGKSCSSFRYWRMLTIASASMGMAVLTKGPLGGVIPLVGFVVYKWFYRTPKISFFHFCYCAALSLSIALSWYLVNWWIHGSQFILGFIQFQQSLFSKPLEGHHGPFYYHFAVAIVGLFPWTPFLLLFKLKLIPKEHPHIRPLLIFSAGWLAFVLVLFSLVTTKLPHYSASIYIPLSFIVAFCLEQFYQKQMPLPRWVIGIYLFLGGIFAVFLMLFPKLFEDFIEKQKIDFELYWSNSIYISGIGLLLGILAGSIFLLKRKIWVATWVIALTMLVCTQGFWRFHVPIYLQYIQQPLLEMVEEVHEKDSELVFYRYVSFAALFYGKRPIEMLHTYKFPGNPEILNTTPEQDIYVITENKYKKRLKREHPFVEFIKDQGLFSLFVLPKKSPSPD